MVCIGRITGLRVENFGDHRIHLISHGHQSHLQSSHSIIWTVVLFMKHKHLAAVEPDNQPVSIKNAEDIRNRNPAFIDALGTTLM